MKSLQIRSFFWSTFSGIRSQYGGLLSKSSYSFQTLENTDHKNSQLSAHSYGYDQYFTYKYIYFYPACAQIQFKGPSREIGRLLSIRLSNVSNKLEASNVKAGLKKYFVFL